MFEILTPTDATLTSVTPRTEKHGDEDVFAITLGLCITGPNTMLDALAPGLREALYKPVDDQEQLPGVEPATPVLRAKVIDSVTLDRSFEGWTIAIEHGIDESEPITLGGAKVDKFKVVPHEGGSVDLSFRVGSSDIDAEEAGALCTKLRQSIAFTLTAPAAQIGERTEATGAEIDGTTGHPGADTAQGSLLDSDAMTPERALAGSLGDPDGQEVDPDDSDESEGGQPDGDADAAKFEAGAAAAIEAAGVKPRRGGRARVAH